ncbi:MAG: indolepyruvate ferredoxin oxidoreductase family protein [Acidimicrobiaceae bacterium]|nr:indolepyruvate ferredoxin oxidoreductase family protein [Acidimicrobiaceae bacterium]
MTQTLLSGVEALVRLLALRHELDQRDGLTTATMVSGYPGSPLGTFDLAVEQAGDMLASHQIVHRPGLNEELAAATVWGSQMGAAVPYAGVDGVAGVWYGKGPGLDRSGDALKHGNAMGSGPNGGVVLFCGDDPTAKSSTLPCDSQYTFEDACVPVLSPGDQQDIIDLGVHAFYLSRYAGCWVGLKIVTAVADGIGTVNFDLARYAPSDPDDLIIDGTPWRHRPLATIGPHQIPDQEILVVHRRLLAARAYVRHNRLDSVFGAPPGSRLGIVCAGKTYYDIRQAVADLGISPEDNGVRILKLAMTYPLVDETVLEFAASVDELLVIEEKRPFVETQLRSLLHEAGSRVPVLGKRDRAGDPLVSQIGELDATAIAGILTRVIPELVPAGQSTNGKTRLPLLELPPRPPAYCSGCPHNRSTVFPDGALVGGGVGCHGMIYFEARHRGMTSLAPTPMGAEGVPWIGLSPFVDEPHLIQNLGDGTLSHSGTLAIRASVAAGANVTFKILYNSAVAMTGGQDVTGLLDVPSLTRTLEAEGVRKVVVCAEDPKRYGRKARWARGVDVLGRDHLPRIQEELRRVPGVTAIIYDQRCAAEARRLRKRGLLDTPPRRVVINEAVCEGCGDCSAKSNCLSVLPLDTELGEKRQVHDPSCNRDYTCLEGDCPSFVTITPRAGKQPGRHSAHANGARHVRPPLPEGILPEPTVPSVKDQYGVYFTGIGGTGVVTANRILAAAAEAAGFVVGGMDQTGLSQKAGAVVSHLHFAADRSALAASTVSAGGADLYLSGDILQAAGDKHLEKVRPGRTIAVVDERVTPTANMLQTDTVPPEVSELEQAITDRVGEGRARFLDSTRIAETVFANNLLANVVLLGAAYQLGGLPVTLADIDRAMQRQGKAAEDNREAFEWGRWAVHDPAAVDTSLKDAEQGGLVPRPGILDPSSGAARRAATVLAGRSVPADLRDLLTRRAAQVIDYQNAKLAGRYLDLVEEVAATDSAEHGWALSRAVAEAWFKLLTYKDEYEVARLHLKADYEHIAGELGIDGSYSVTYHLHPPTLRRMGLKRKLAMGKPYEVAFHALSHMKRLRGTPFDIFGRDPDRRTERELIKEYEQVVRNSKASMSYDQRVEIAGSALAIKGYATVKEAAVARWRTQVARLAADA